MICTIEGCTNSHMAKGWCRKHYYQDYNGRPFTLDTHGNTKGDVVEYRAAHARVEVARGKARDGNCTCGAQATEWSLDDTTAVLTSAESGHEGLLYSLDVMAYERACRRCHMNKDGNPPPWSNGYRA